MQPFDQEYARSGVCFSPQNAPQVFPNPWRPRPCFQPLVPGVRLHLWGIGYLADGVDGFTAVFLVLTFC